MYIFTLKKLVVDKIMLTFADVTPHRPCHKAYFGVSVF